MTQSIVINVCFGGFSLSDAAYERLADLGVPVVAVGGGAGERVIFDRELSSPQAYFGGRYWDTWTRSSRTDPLLVQVVRELGAAASGSCAELAIVEIPDDVEWHIDEYDGLETIHENHRSWSAS